MPHPSGAGDKVEIRQAALDLANVNVRLPTVDNADHVTTTIGILFDRLPVNF